jgi:hypothetical protein
MVPCRKKIGPLQWDLSVAEHLQPGEDYRKVRLCNAPCAHPCIAVRSAGGVERSMHGVLPAQAAARGLREELGIEVEASLLAGPLVPPHLRELHAPEVGVLDREFVTSFR